MYMHLSTYVKKQLLQVVGTFTSCLWTSRVSNGKQKLSLPLAFSHIDVGNLRPWCRLQGMRRRHSPAACGARAVSRPAGGQDVLLRRLSDSEQRRRGALDTGAPCRLAAAAVSGHTAAVSGQWQPQQPGAGDRPGRRRRRRRYRLDQSRSVQRLQRLGDWRNAIQQISYETASLPSADGAMPVCSEIEFAVDADGERVCRLLMDGDARLFSLSDDTRARVCRLLMVRASLLSADADGELMPVCSLSQMRTRSTV